MMVIILPQGMLFRGGSVGGHLDATHKELVAIDKAIKAATAKHNTFLKELNLPPLS